jgi:DnaJ-class molecular chaperone
MPLLLRIVANDVDAIEASAKRMRTSPLKLREASAFYVEQILLAPNANSYRVLGAQPTASATELRQNLACLCKWLNSESCQAMARSAFFLRVTHAWNNLKTPERRAGYDATLEARVAALRASRADQTGEHAKLEKRNGQANRWRGETWVERGEQARIDNARKRGGDSLWDRLIAYALRSRAS